MSSSRHSDLNDIAAHEFFETTAIRQSLEFFDGEKRLHGGHGTFRNKSARPAVAAWSMIEQKLPAAQDAPVEVFDQLAFGRFAGGGESGLELLLFVGGWIA